MKLPARLSGLFPSQKEKERSPQKHMPSIDERPEAIVQRKENEMIAGSPRTLEQQQRFAGSLGGMKQDGVFNNTGMPDTLKAGLENLSGLDLSDVKVHYNSCLPAQYQALAYAQGREIHLAPGQQQHLPHEGWHIVQQRQQKVKPTLQWKNGQHLNDQAHLEQEADVMGAKAAAEGRTTSPGSAAPAKAQPASIPLCNIAQMKFIVPKADPKSTEVRELSADEVKEIRAKLAGDAAALKVFETEMTKKSYHIIEHQGSAEANIAFIISFCKEEAGRQQKATPPAPVSAAPDESKKAKTSSSSSSSLPSSSPTSTGSRGKAWKQGLTRKKQKGADGTGVQPVLNEDKRKRGHRGGKRHVKAGEIMEKTVGSNESTANFGHLIARKLGGGEEAANKAVTTERQEQWQKVVEKAVADALRNSILKAEHVRLKVTAYTIPDSRDIAKALRIKVLLFDGAEGGYVKMIDITTTHQCEVDPDESVQKRIRKVLEHWGNGKGNVYDWIRIHDGYTVRN